MKKMKKNVVLILFLAMLALPLLVNADLPGAASYLKTQTQDPWATQALVAAGETNYSIDQLKSVNGSLATDYAKTILALAAVGENPATFGNIDYVQKLKTYFNNNQFGETSLLNDDAWAILALAAVGEKNSTEVQVAKNYLLANQNSNGGWGYGAGGDSDTNDTAAIIIALLEAGVNPSEASITNAVGYLKNVQNNDGGFGWQTGSASDSGSDAWVITAINKLGQSSADWQKEGKNPVEHLWSLQDTDGGFWWVAPGTSDFNNKAMTSYAVIALSGKSFPVGYFTNNNAPTGDNHVRIESKNNTVCDTYVNGTTALDAVVKAAAQCNFTYTIEDATFGKYLKQVGDDVAAGMSGWLYFVNSVSPAVGAVDYNLNKGDEVLWYFGDWGWQPIKLSVSKSNLSSSGKTIIDTKYFDGQNWLALAGANIKGLSNECVTDQNGQIELTLSDGAYNVFAEKNGYVRSNKVLLTVGNGISQNVNMSVEVTQGAIVSGESIIFSVSPNKLDFGKMKSGESKSNNVLLSNQGTVNLEVKAAVNGDSLFTDNIKINEQTVNNFTRTLASDESYGAVTTLSIPATYLSSGVKNGEIIFWARAK